MHKIYQSIFVLLLVLVLSACGSFENENDPLSGAGQETTYPEATQLIPTGTEPAFGDVEPTSLPGEPPANQTPGADVQEDDILVEVQEVPTLATYILGYDAASASGAIGNVVGLIVDAVNGQLRYVVVETVGPEPSREIALPNGAFQITALPPGQPSAGAEQAPMVWVTASDDDLVSAPDYDEALLAEGNANWDVEIRDYWSERLSEMPVTGDQADDSASNLLWIGAGLVEGIDFDVQGQQGEDLGEVEDLVINTDGSILFALIEPDTLLDLGSDYIPVPMNSLNWNGQDETFTLNAGQEAFNNAPRMDMTNLPDMSAPGWETEWSEYWQGQ